MVISYAGLTSMSRRHVAGMAALTIFLLALYQIQQAALKLGQVLGDSSNFSTVTAKTFLSYHERPTGGRRWPSSVSRSPIFFFCSSFINVTGSQCAGHRPHMAQCHALQRGERLDDRGTAP
ncbi:hypothetical protein C8J57DRAFT_1282948, partial [Mycena rebaudengoi]